MQEQQQEQTHQSKYEQVADEPVCERDDPVEAATGLVAAGDYPAAIETLSRAIEREPTCARYWAYRGRLRRLSDEQAAAQADMNQAIRLDPSDPYPKAQKAWILWVLGRRSQAKALLRRVARRHPDYHWAWAFLAQQHLVTRQLRAGVRAGKQALAISPTCVYSLRIMGDLLANLGEHRSALGAFRQVLEVTPNDPFALAECALVDAHLGDLDAGIDKLSRALDNAPLIRHFWRDRAALFVLGGDASSALEDYLELLELSPNEPYVLMRVARLRATLGDEAAARRDRARALAMARAQLTPRECALLEQESTKTRWNRQRLLSSVGIMEELSQPLR